MRGTYGCVGDKMSGFSTWDLCVTRHYMMYSGPGLMQACPSQLPFARIKPRSHVAT